MRERPSVRSYAIVAAALIAIVVAGLTTWLVPHLQVVRWRRAGISDAEKLAELGLQARGGITQALGGLALIVTIAITAYQVNQAKRSADRAQESAATNLKLAEQGQNAERFSRAIEQLGATNHDGSPAVDIRVGALLSLRSVGLDSKKDTAPVFNVAAAYVVDNYEQPRRRAKNGCDAAFVVRPDVRVALKFVLPAIALKLPHPVVGLRGAPLDDLALDHLVLSGFELTNIKFRRASLVRANFSTSTLSGARFDRACLRNADFRQAKLGGARFDGAALEGAKFEGAKFEKSDLAHANLSPAQRASVTIVGR
jgi:hypothetical protein